MIRKKNTKPVGYEYTAYVKSSWKSLTMWFNRLLMSAGFIDLLLMLAGQGSVLTKYIGEHTPVILMSVGYMGAWLRKRTHGAVK